MVDLPNTRLDWLKRILGGKMSSKSENILINGAVGESVRRARGKQASRFFATIFLPMIEDGKNVTCDEFLIVLDDFKKENSEEEGIDFEIGHVWAVSFEQTQINEKQSKRTPPRTPPNAEHVRLAYEMLTGYELETTPQENPQLQNPST